MKSIKGMFALVALGFGLVAGGEAYYQTRPVETVRVTVTDKDRQVTSSGKNGVSSKYIVFTDKETFENSDSLLRWKFNSSDLQGSLKRDQQYDLKVYGFRNHPFSIYRNILSATPVTDATPQTPPPAAPKAPQS